MSFSTCCRLIASFLVLISPQFIYAQSQSKPDQRDTLGIIADQERQRLIDPATGTVPYERLDEARRQLNNHTSTTSGAPVGQNGIPNISWLERGPSNMGGRTRTFLFDPNDPTHKKAWAGSVVGGLWYTNDITDANAAWTPVSDTWESAVVTALAADPTNPQVMYAGTGDAYSSVKGGGIWRTTDGGQSWNRLTSTIPGGSYPSPNFALSFIQRIVVNKSGNLFVATNYGIVKSTDGGSSWSYSLDPAQSVGTIGVAKAPMFEQVTDLEIGSDGVMYTAFYGNDLYKSADGITWTTITPANTVLGERTELALAPSTSGAGQVVYGVSRAYNNVNYGQDIKWFKKSTDGGTTWTDVSIPTFSGGNYFTSGNGYYALNLLVHPTDANTVYAGGYDWFRSTNGGASWGDRFTTMYQYQQGLWFQPGSGTNAVLIADNGISWSTDWGNNSTVNPTLNSRNNGYRVSEVNSVAMKASPGSSYLFASVSSSGIVQMTSAGISAGNLVWSATYPGATFIDEDDPNTQILEYNGVYYRYDGAGNSSFIGSLNIGRTYNPSDYDSQANLLYAAESDDSNLSYKIRKMVVSSSTVTSTQLPLTGLTNAVSFLKLSKDRTALFVGSYPGKVYKITNLNQATPTTTAIDNGALPQYTTVSSIDIGADDNELLVTLSNYGVQSIWYTNDGGQSWTGKDQLNYGLPDIPVRYALFNPQNRKQVLLATELGVWSTTDITAANPGWTSTSGGLGNHRVNQLRYRSSDGRITAATSGRGVWTTDAFAIPYTLPSVAITDISQTTLCTGYIFTISFSTTGPAFGTGNTFNVWLSDANGSFTNQLKLGSGTSSPISVILPIGNNAVSYGANYRIKIISTNPEIESGQSSAIAIGTLTNAAVYDRRTEALQNYNSGTICPGSMAVLQVFGRDVNYNRVTPESYSWSLNGAVISGATSATLLTQQAGNYTATVKQVGCVVTSSQYTLSTSGSISSFVVSRSNGEPQCDDHPLTLLSGYIGTTASYQWTRDGIDIAGATSYTYTATQTGSYGHRLTDGSCSTNSSSYYFQFGRSLYAKVFLTSTSDSLLCSASANYSISMYASFPTSNDYTIQWYRNGILIPGATSVYYYASQPGAYSILLKQGTCQAYSNAVTIRLADQLKPAFSYSYPTKSACPGETRNLNTNIYNASVQWQKDGLDIMGATGSNYAATVSGNYTLKITRGQCSAISDPVSLTFSDTYHPIVGYTLSESCYGVYLSTNNGYTLTGSQYQWYKNGAALSGSTTSYYYTTQSGAYSVKVTNGTCTGFSKEVYIDAGTGRTAKPIISSSAATNQACINNSLQLMVNYYTGSLQWKRNGVAIPGATSYQLYASQSGLYSVLMQDGFCQSESDPVEIKIGEATTASLSGNALISAGQSALLPVTFTGPAPWSFTLTNGQSVTATYQNPAFIAVSPASATTYQLASVTNACGPGTTSGQAIVSVGSGSADVSLNMAVSNRSPKVGDVVNYTLMATNAGPQDATGLQLTSRLPAGLAFVNATTPGITFADGVVSADVGSIAINDMKSLSFQVTPTQPGTFITSAQITASQTPDPDSQPNSGTGDGQDDAATVDLRTPDGGTFAASMNPDQVPLSIVAGNQPVANAATADLSLAMQLDNLTPVVAQNSLVTTTLTVSNRGGSSASSIILQVELPNGSFSAQSPSGWIQVNSRTYKIYVNQLSAGKASTVSLKWQPSGYSIVKAQVLDVAEPDSDSTPGNGYDNGEDDEASVSIRTK